MKATDAKLLDLLNVRKQFVIPIYQRKYSWKKTHCEKLWDDILKAAIDPNVRVHFIGSIVYIQEEVDTPDTLVPEQLVIDGQQRLITISLLLAALAKAKNFDKQKSQELKDYYLFHAHREGDQRYRLKPTESDRKNYFSLLEDNKNLVSTSTLVDNYNFFDGKLQNEDADFLTKIYHGISKIKIVDVSLKRGEDDPQLIFESLNSTGLDLSQADLIRNFILMRLKPTEQEELYNKYWSQMEQNFDKSEHSGRIDRFIRDYLTIKNEGNIPAIRDVYAKFQDHVGSLMDVEIRDIVAEIYQYSNYYIYLQDSSRLESTDKNGKKNEEKLRYILDDIKELKVDVAYPFLMEVHHDYTNQKIISQEEYIEILLLVESYVFRRAICGIPTASLNKTFATLSKELVKDGGHYLESFKAALMLKESYRRFPDDDEFKREMMVKDLYRFRNCRYYLTKLEKPYHKEINIKECEIEHIMPQTLSYAWRMELGEDWEAIHNRYIHTIGNLTLAAYNKEYSNRPFLEKRDLVVEDRKVGLGISPIRLNSCLGEIEHWNETEIKKRAVVLAMRAKYVWPYPKLSSEVLAKYGERKRSVTEVEPTMEDSLEDEDLE